MSELRRNLLFEAMRYFVFIWAKFNNDTELHKVNTGNSGIICYKYNYRGILFVLTIKDNVLKLEKTDYKPL